MKLMMKSTGFAKEKEAGTGRFLRTAYCLLPSAFCLLLSAFCFLPSAVRAQTVADKTIATVSNGARATPDLITYSDLVWQLALEPARPFSARPGSPELNQALKTLEDQLLVLQEARKLPLAATPEPTREFQHTVKHTRDELEQLFDSLAR